MDRDFDQNPYTTDEARVVAYLASVAPDIGAGDDPIGFLISSHHMQAKELTKLKADLAFNPVTGYRGL